jgi:hypothetical protein
MSAELTEHLGYERHQEPSGGTGNERNGTTPKMLVTEHGRVQVKAPRTASSTSATGHTRGVTLRAGWRGFSGALWRSRPGSDDGLVGQSVSGRPSAPRKYGPVGIPPARNNR